jgi:hypothetical protein
VPMGMLGLWVTMHGVRKGVMWGGGAVCVANERVRVVLPVTVCDVRSLRQEVEGWRVNRR